MVRTQAISLNCIKVNRFFSVVHTHSHPVLLFWKQKGKSVSLCMQMSHALCSVALQVRGRSDIWQYEALCLPSLGTTAIFLHLLLHVFSHHWSSHMASSSRLTYNKTPSKIVSVSLWADLVQALPHKWVSSMVTQWDLLALCILFIWSFSISVDAWPLLLISLRGNRSPTQSFLQEPHLLAIPSNIQTRCFNYIENYSRCSGI